MREPVPDARPRVVTVATMGWGLALLALVVTAALIGSAQQNVRRSLVATLESDEPGTSLDAIRKTADITLIAGGVGALLVLLLGAMGVLQVRARTAGGRSVLTIVGIVAAAGSVAFWFATRDAVDAVPLAPVAAWAPLAVAVLVVVGTAPLYRRDVGEWLTGERS